MGCDIHPLVVVGDMVLWDRGYWEEEVRGEILSLLPDSLPDKQRAAEALSVLTERNYDKFAVLANVRNGYGFAGVETGEGFVPIQVGRGLPEDIEKLCDQDFHFLKEGDWQDRIAYRSGYWLGDHSHGWVTLKELLDYPHWDSERIHHGVISAAEYESWDGKEPVSYCGATMGEGIKTYTPETYWQAKVEGNLVRRPHVRVSWPETVRQSLERFCTIVIPWLQTLHSDSAQVRLVFGFDS